MTQNHHTQLPANAQTITFDAVNQSFPQSGKNTHEVLREVSFTAAAGEIISVIGASGCGKSTLLRAAAGLNRITGGQVRIGDTPVSGLDQRVAIGFQEPRLLPWRTVADNVALGLPQGNPKTRAQERIRELLRLVGLTNYATHAPKKSPAEWLRGFLWRGRWRVNPGRCCWTNRLGRWMR